MKRIFVALPLPDPIKAKVHEWMQLQGRSELSFQTWVHPDDLHLTLKFIGETDEGKIEPLHNALTEAVSTIKPFILTLDRLGTFGAPAAPSILWAGIAGDAAPLHRLQHSVETSLVPLGIEQEKRSYHPHLTIARRYNGKSKMNREAFSQSAELFSPKGLSWQADHLVLYESRLGQKPMYQEMFKVSFPK